jgi:hypothetical protein
MAGIGFHAGRYPLNRSRIYVKPLKKMLQVLCAIFRVTRFFCYLRRVLTIISLVILCLAHTPASRAQERVRTAAGQLKIESFRNPEAFFRVGPFQEELTGSTGFEYSDNAGLNHTGKISRLSLFEALDLKTTWVISYLNRLEFDFAGQLMEDFYGNGRSQVNVGVAPNSKVQFQFAVSDFLVRIFDQFSYVQEPSSNPTATNTANLNSLTNTIGATVDADLNLAILSLSADYSYNNQSGSTVQGQTNPTTSGSRNSFRVGSSLSFKLPPAIIYGLETTLTRTTGASTGNRNGSANVNSLNVGPFIRGQLSQWTDLDLAVGATLVDAKPQVPPNYYVSAVARHQFNQNWQVILSGSHELLFTTGTDLTEETIFRAATEFHLTRFTNLNGASFLGFGNEKTGSNPGNFKQYGLAAGVEWKPRKHLSGALTYRFIRREADSAANTYLENSISFQINYTF